MLFPNVRRLAALDMYGSNGARLRRAVIRAEYWFGVIGCFALGALAVALFDGWAVLFGVWLLTIGLNYVPLALFGELYSKPGSLDAYLHREPIGREWKSLNATQFWIFVPFVMVVLAVVQLRARRRRTR